MNMRKELLKIIQPIYQERKPALLQGTLYTAVNEANWEHVLSHPACKKAHCYISYLAFFQTKRYVQLQSKLPSTLTFK